MIEYSQYTAKEFLDVLCSILPQEIDKWQAEVIFKNVSIDIKNGIVNINLEKGSPTFIKSKYENNNIFYNFNDGFIFLFKLR